MKILVVGGTGLVGSTVVRELVRRDADVRLLVRDAKTAVPSGVDVAVGDLLDPPAVERAMEGADKLYLLNAVTPDELTQALIAFDLAKRRKFRRVVYHSVFRVDHFLDVPHFASKFAIESALRAFDVPWTILRPNYFFQNDATLRDSLTVAGVYPQPLGETGISAVDVRDIAEATALALTAEGHRRSTISTVRRPSAARRRRRSGARRSAGPSATAATTWTRSSPRCGSTRRPGRPSTSG